MKTPWILAALLAIALAVFAVYGWAEHRNRKDAEVRADSALAWYHRLKADSAATAKAERASDARTDSLRQHLAAARDTIHVLHREVAALDTHTDSTVGAAITVRDFMVAYRDAYTAQRAATGRLLAAAALVSDSLVKDLDSTSTRSILDARADRDRWKESADRLAKSVAELNGSGKIFGFIPKPPKWAAVAVGCLAGGLIDSKDRARGCGLGGAALAVATPTD